MKIEFFCPRWGSEQLSWTDFMEQVKAAGYDGIEYAIANDTSRKELDGVWNAAGRYGLQVIAQHYNTSSTDFAEHYDIFAGWLEKISSYKPIKINSQTGRDFFGFEHNGSLINMANRFSEQSGIEVVHETHRSRFSFAAHVTKEYLIKMPSLKLTLDVSHWVSVAESFLEDQPEAMALALSRAGHIHARVGYPQGPQIPDPRAEEWWEALHIHISWWDEIVERKKKEDDGSVLTITPEFGPAPYMVILPHTREPIAGQWEVNEYMLNLLKNRYTL